MHKIKRDIYTALRPLKNRLETWRASWYDRAIFLKGYSSNARGANEEQLCGHLLLHAHALEKAITHSEFQERRGARVLDKMEEALTEYEARGFDKDAFAFRYALSAIREFILLTRKHGYDETFIVEHIGQTLFDHALEGNDELAGVLSVQKKDKANNQEKSFVDLFMGRCSVREYSEKTVSLEQIRRAIQIATKAPSVCNRQDARVYVMKNEAEINKVLSVHTGFRGYKNPPVLLLVTADNSQFVSSIEHNQSFIDGGLFGMALLLAIESEGLAACPLNAMLKPIDENKVRSIIGVKESESLITFIAVGHFKESVMAPRSPRLKGEEITTIVEDM